MSVKLDQLLEHTALRTLDPNARFVRGLPGKVVVAKDVARGPWAYELDAAPRPRVSSLACFQEAMAHHMMVCSEITWDALEAEVGGTTYALPLTPEFLLGHYKSERGRRRPAESWLWPLAGESDTSVMLVYGFEILGVEASPFSEGVLEADEVLFGADVLDEKTTEADCACSAEQGSVHDVYVMPTRILVAVSFVCMRAKTDFDPMGALVACRFYPIFEIVTNTDVDRIDTRLSLRRPKLTHPMPEMSPVINAALFTDANPGAALLPIPEVPFWSAIFSYYDADAAMGTRFRAVDSSQRSVRVNTADRKAHRTQPAQNAPRYVPTSVRKVAQQGEFDNLHLAPRMLRGSQEVVMAPVCEHDCMHTHWRWGDGYTNKESLGWGESTPHAEPGAPMVPRNQDVWVRVHDDGAGFTYEATLHAVHWVEIQPVFHHGSAYALGVDSFLAESAMLAAGGAANWYYQLRYFGGNERVLIADGAAGVLRLRKL